MASGGKSRAKSAVINGPEFSRRLAAKSFDLAPVYLLFGSEPKRVADDLNRLKNRILSLTGEEGYRRYVRLGDGGDEPDAGDVIATLNTVAMFGGGHVAVVGPLPGLSDAEIALFTSYAQNPNPQSVLALAIAAPKSEAKKLAKIEKSPLLKAVVAAGVAVKYSPPKAGEVEKWAEERFKAKGVTIDREGLLRLCQLCQGDFDRIGMEVEKLTAYIGDRDKVTLEDVSETVGDHREASLWDYTNAIRDRNAAKAFIALESLMTQNAPAQMILKTVTGDLARIGVAVAGRKERWNSRTAATEVGDHPFVMENAFRAAALWDEESVRRGLASVMEASFALMKAGAEPSTAMAALTDRLCAKDKQTRGETPRD